ncbi:Rhodanese-like protein [Patellaria atrata CBS 101060]|uniref:Rhodanese-like protein n=1 Tax=Patellaria atrata CBS 101060 TaxID=1346257 RepID=A0A9P4S765_9PEZI|nr:Rhodanese-like protein [Patellaria atrata CBS 101060]
MPPSRLVPRFSLPTTPLSSFPRSVARSISICKGTIHTVPGAIDARAGIRNQGWIRRAGAVGQGQVRWHSAPPTGSKVYDFEEISGIVEEGGEGKERVLVDVREPHELEQGRIPTAHNLPLQTHPDAIFLPAEEFEAQFGFPKPRAEQEIVFYCKAGVRSSAAAQLALRAGYQKVGEYRGSWLDWQRKGGEIEGGNS